MLNFRLFATVIPLTLLATTSPVEGTDRSISAEELYQRFLIHNAPFILDVRTRAEFAVGHIRGAVNIPHLELSDRLGEITRHKEKEIIVHCERGGRASTADVVLRGGGFIHIRQLRGHLTEWRKKGLPLETSILEAE